MKCLTTPGTRGSHWSLADGWWSLADGFASRIELVPCGFLSRWPFRNPPLYSCLTIPATAGHPKLARRSRAEPKTCPERTRRRLHGGNGRVGSGKHFRDGPSIGESIKLICGGNAFTRRRRCPAHMGCFDSVRLPPHFAQHDSGGRFATCYLKNRYLLLEVSPSLHASLSFLNNHYRGSDGLGGRLLASGMPTFCGWGLAHLCNFP